jgi:hypothetical protein
VHGSTLSIRASRLASHELRKGLDKRASAAKENAVISVGGDDAVSLGDGGLHADGDGLLAVVEVAEASNEFGLVEGIGGDLHAAHDRHVVEEGEQLLRSGLHGARRRLDPVGRERDAGLDGEDRLIGAGGEEASGEGAQEGAGGRGGGGAGDGAAEEGSDHG